MVLQGNGLFLTPGKLEAEFMQQHLEKDSPHAEAGPLLTLNLAQE